MANIDPVTGLDFDLPEPIEATHRRTGAPTIVQPDPAAWRTLLTTGHVTWTEPDSGEVYEAEWP